MPVSYTHLDVYKRQTEFAPNQPMTRAMFVKVLANNTANFTPYDGSTPFTDVRPGDWYCDAVNLSLIHILWMTAAW